MPAISFDLALEPSTLRQVYELFTKLMVGPCELQYTLSVGFLTFRSPSASVDMPTLDEFKTGRPYFSDEISVSVRHPHKKDA
jgi:hypothetical protein